MDEMRHYARRHPEVRAHPHVSGQAAAIRWHHPELAAIERPDVTAWQAFLDRTLPRKGRDADPYAAFMKHGLGERYWFEYVFEAYASDRPDAIFLAGLPDIAESRPHSRVNAG